MPRNHHHNLSPLHNRPSALPGLGKGKKRSLLIVILNLQKKEPEFLEEGLVAYYSLMEVLKMKVGMATMVEVVLLPFPLIETAGLINHIFLKTIQLN